MNIPVYLLTEHLPEGRWLMEITSGAVPQVGWTMDIHGAVRGRYRVERLGRRRDATTGEEGTAVYVSYVGPTTRSGPPPAPSVN